ncbi:MAG: PIN domain-containing protein [Methylococcaceae bacterium]|nr:PIN domain-containing protein [Methylococcaceae bacterium]
MRVLVDTCIWSQALRRKKPQQHQPSVEQLTKLIEQKQVVMLGVIRQEILSGIQHEAQFERIRAKLRAFPDYPVTTTDFETAAQFYNLCRANGVQGSDTDFLLCAIAHNYEFTILTADKDFQHFKKHLNFELDLIEQL